MTHKLGITFLANAPLPEGHAFIEVFHDWIRRKELEELMIDVADYGHVQGGPSVYFCGHESDYAIVRSVRPGILYRRKRAPDANGSSFADGLGRVARVITKLQTEPKLAGLSLDPSRFVLGFYDRLAAPNTDEGAAAMIAAMRPAIEARVGAAEIMRSKNEPRGVLELEVKPASGLVFEKLVSG